MTRVEVVRHRFGFDDRDGFGQQRVERLGRAFGRRASFDVDAHDLAERMHACVRATGDREPLDGGEQSRERLAHRRLDGGKARLGRPAVERGAVVLERQLQSHVRCP